MDENLDDLVRRVDPDRWLSSRFIGDAQARADVVTLYAYDHELARAPRVASNPILGEIRLTWWREALDEVFDGREVRRHPTAQALAEMIRRRGMPREPFEALIDARYRELDPAPMSATEAETWARNTGGRIAEMAVAILDPGADPLAANAAGTAWSLSRRADRAQFDHVRREARGLARGLSVAAFPAVAHAALGGAAGSELGRRLRILLAVVRGRI